MLAPAPIIQFLKRHPRLRNACLSVYFLPKTLRRKLRAKILKHPHLLIYVFFARDLLRGKVRSSLTNIARQIIADVMWLHPKSRAARKTLKRLYGEAILCCARHRLQGWWAFFHNTKFNDVPTLQLFLRDYVLRRAGDYQEYIRIRRELKPLFDTTQKDEFYDRMAEHYAKTIQDIEEGRLYSSASDKRIMLIGISVWGKHYLDTLVNYCLPSLSTEGNMGILCEQRKVVMLVHTTPEGKERISQAPVAQKLQARGVEIVYRMLDEALLKAVPEDSNNKYWHLGMVQSLDLFMAKYLNADYHLLMPDTIFSENHFRGMLNIASRGYQAITKTGYRTCMEGVVPMIENYRRDGSINVPAADLAAIAIRHMHTDSKPLFVTGRDINTELPAVHVLIFEGKDKLHLLSPHQTILYLDRAAARRLSKRYFITLDSELDKIIPEDVAAYSPKAEDEMNIIEISHDALATVQPNISTLKDFYHIFWANAESPAYLKFFAEDTTDPINRAMLPERPYMDEAAIENAKQTVRKGVAAHYPVSSAKQIRIGLDILKEIKVHYKGRGDITTLLAETAQQIQGTPTEEIQAKAA